MNNFTNWNCRCNR